MIQVNLDCEGPLTQNDNAYELCEKFIPRGGIFFANVSRYDDYLADVVRRPGYKAGDTLKLVLPFLKASGVTSAAMREFSAATLRLLPGTRQMLPRMAARFPVFIISTSYRPYLDALCDVTGFPPDNIYCTECDIDAYTIPDSERKLLMELAGEIAAQPMMSWPHDAAGVEDLDRETACVLERLEEIFWRIIPGMKAGRMLDEINPVGGTEKAVAVSESLERTGLRPSDVFYAGDSITDVQALELVREGGGAALSFNGNSYAVRSASWACLSPATAVIGALAEAMGNSGVASLATMSFDSSGMADADAVCDFLRRNGVEDDMFELLAQGRHEEEPRIYDLGLADIPAVITESEAFRKGVRGISVGNLG